MTHGWGTHEGLSPFALAGRATLFSLFSICYERKHGKDSIPFQEVNAAFDDMLPAVRQAFTDHEDEAVEGVLFWLRGHR